MKLPLAMMKILKPLTVLTLAGALGLSGQVIFQKLTVANVGSAGPTNPMVTGPTNYVVANSGSYGDVLTAVTAAQVANIPTVWIPGGTNQWTNGLVESGVSLLASNTCSILFTTNLTASGIYILASSNAPVTVSNFVFDSTSTGPSSYIVGLDGSGYCFRFTKCTFLSSAVETLTIGTTDEDTNMVMGPFGLVDHCNFYLPGVNNAYNAMEVRGRGAAINYSWTQPMSWGTTNVVCVENCNFSVWPPPPTANPNAVMEGQDGLRAVIRYCNMTNFTESTHGTQSGSPNVRDSALQLEMYMNTWVLTNGNAGDTYNYLLLQRGGSSVIWSNTYINQMAAAQYGVGYWAKFWVECASAEWASESCPSQLAYPANYPAIEQIGQGVVGGMQGYQPVYIWSNNWCSANFPIYVLGADADSAFIVQGRDIYTNSVMPGYTPLVYPHPQDH